MKMFFVEMIKQLNVFGDKVRTSNSTLTTTRMICGRHNSHEETCSKQGLRMNFVIFHLGAVPENSKQYYGFTRFAIELNELDDELRKQLPPTDTRFRPDQRFVD